MSWRATACRKAISKITAEAAQNGKSYKNDIKKSTVFLPRQSIFL